MKTYTLHVAGLTRELPICAVSDTLDIAAFIMLGDVELTKATAAELLKKYTFSEIGGVIKKALSS